MRHDLLTNKNITIIIFGLLAFSCSRGGYSKVYDLPSAEWIVNSAVNFEFSPSDTLSRHDIDIILRHGSEFAISELTLELKTVTPSQLFWCDTISILLKNEKNEWLGKRFSAGVDIQTNYRKHVTFQEAGRYSLSFRQLSQDTLPGIMAVGVNVYPENKK